MLCQFYFIFELKSTHYKEMEKFKINMGCIAELGVTFVPHIANNVHTYHNHHDNTYLGIKMYYFSQ